MNNLHDIVDEDKKDNGNASDDLKNNLLKQDGNHLVQSAIALNKISFVVIK